MVCSGASCRVCTDAAPYIKSTASGPDYYKTLSPEPIDVITGWGLDFCTGAVIKYISRAGKKPGESKLSDLKKARYFLQRLIDLEESK